TPAERAPRLAVRGRRVFEVTRVFERRHRVREVVARFAVDDPRREPLAVEKYLESEVVAAGKFGREILQSGAVMGGCLLRRASAPGHRRGSDEQRNDRGELNGTGPHPDGMVQDAYRNTTARSASAEAEQRIPEQRRRRASYRRA